MRSRLALVLGLAVLCPLSTRAESVTGYVNSPKFKAMRAAQVDEDIAEARYLNCLAAEAERIGGPSSAWAAVADKIHGHCPDQAAAFWKAHKRAREASGAPIIAEDESGLTHELNGALLGLSHQRREEAEIRHFETSLDKRLATGLAFGKCMHAAAMKADDQVSKPTEIARKIVDACPAEEKRDLDVSVEGESADVVANEP